MGTVSYRVKICGKYLGQRPSFLLRLDSLPGDKIGSREKRKLFGGALLTCALGTYYFLEIAPALFILPVIWLCVSSSVESRANPCRSSFQCR